MNDNTVFDTIPPPQVRSGSAWYDRAWVRVTASMLGLGALVGVAGFAVPAQWVGRVWPTNSVVDDGAVAFSPGSAREVDDSVVVDGLEVFVPEGEILYTTVAIAYDISVWEWVEANLRDEVELRPRDQVLGNRSESENRSRNLELMAVSKDTAVLVALDHLGVDVVDVTGVGFGATVPDQPADGVLEVGEVIVAIDGEPVTTLGSLQALLAARPPGTEAVLTVEHHESLERRDVTLTLGVHLDPDNDGGFIGIEDPQERATQRPLPFEVDIESGSVGGPSAGLAFTLSIIDLLSEGELTGGARVAVTGTIRLDGSIGPVGGVAQKAVAAAESGADLFIVPAASVAEARSTAGDLRVVGVETLDDALRALAELGGQTEELAVVEVSTSE